MDELRKGEKGTRVREFHEYLKILGFYIGDDMDEFNDITINSVKSLQVELYLLPTGVLDLATTQDIESLLTTLRGSLSCLGYFTNDVLQSGPENLRVALTACQTDQGINRNGCYDGDTKSSIRNELAKLQGRLHFLGDYKGFVDGGFNPFITLALFAFQRRMELPVSGIRDVTTQLALVQNARIIPDCDGMPEQRKFELVAAIQGKLRRVGLYRGPKHGQYDLGTIAAIREFQTRNHLHRSDGVCDADTWRHLNQNAGTNFTEVFQWELDALDEERTGIIPDKAEARPASESDVLDRAHRNQLWGLSLSGGGARSAIFNLGVLTAMAEQRLLSEFHYLSTAGGGGYIGSWLSKWIHEEGGRVENVESKLSDRTSGRDNNSAIAQVAYLRASIGSQVGMFSRQSLAHFAAYLRNVMLNMIVIVAILSAVLLVPRVLLWLVYEYGAAIKYGELYTPGFAPWFGGVALVAFLVAEFFMSISISLVPHDFHKSDRLYSQELESILTRVVLPLMLFGFFGSIFLWYEFEGIKHYLIDWRYWITATLIYLIVWAAGWIAAQRVNSNNGVRLVAPRGLWSAISPHIVFSVFSIVTFHQLIAFTVVQFGGGVQSIDPLNHPVNLVAFGMPVALTIFGISMVLLIGLLGRAYSDRNREWWSHVGGWMIICAVGWIVLFAVSIYAPPLVAWTTAKYGAWVPFAIVLTFLLASIFGARYGLSDRDSSTPIDLRANPLFAIAPSYLIFGLFLLTTAAIQWLAPPVFLFALLSIISMVIQSLVTIPIVPGDTTLAAFLNAGLFASALSPIGILLLGIAACLQTAALFAWRVDTNKFSMLELYRSRLVRCFLGASNPKRTPDPFTGTDMADDLHIAKLLWKSNRDQNDAVQAVQKPLHLINTTLNHVKGKERAWQEDNVASFQFSASYCGFETPESSHDSKPMGYGKSALGSYRPSREYGAVMRDPVGGHIAVGRARDKCEHFHNEQEGVKLGEAMAISGAAPSPNMGYHSNQALSFLMTTFNVRLGRWNANPSKDAWRTPSPRFGFGWLVREFLGFASAESNYVYLTDAGHFENLGIYELVRRRCAMIVAVDVTSDPNSTFSEFSNAIRKCYTDFGVEIDIQVGDVEINPATGFAKKQWAVGKIKYGKYESVDGKAESGILVYVKPVLTGSEPAELVNYRKIDRKFPLDSASKQFLDRAEFDNYRKLGAHIGNAIFAEICSTVDQEMAGNRRARIMETIRHTLNPTIDVQRQTSPR
jgi:peptidoglycan hydrolase-like protein with peptidoglycan-binding domain